MGCSANFAARSERKMVEFLQDAKSGFWNAQYTDEEYAGHIGWGHSHSAAWSGSRSDANVEKALLFPSRPKP